MIVGLRIYSISVAQSLKKSRRKAKGESEIGIGKGYVSQSKEKVRFRQHFPLMMVHSYH